MSDAKKGGPQRFLERVIRSALDIGTMLVVLKIVGVEPLASQWQWWQVAAPWIAIIGFALLCLLLLGIGTLGERK
jgi:hypothetical protein